MIFKPQKIVSRLQEIDWPGLHVLGYRYVAFDKDNTLSNPGSLSIHPSIFSSFNSCIETFKRENIVIVSNSAGSYKDKNYIEANKIEQELKISVLRHSMKPFNAGKLMAHFKQDNGSKIVIVGDRVLTVFINNLGRGLWQQYISIYNLD